MRAKTKTEDGLVHGITEILGKNQGRETTLCLVWSHEPMPTDAVVTCFECIDMLEKLDFLEGAMRGALKKHIGEPLTNDVRERVAKVTTDLLDRWKHKTTR